MKLPHSRGPLGRAVADALQGPVDGSRDGRATLAAAAADALERCDDVLADEDVQLSLYVLYELAYRGFDGVDDDWEWDPDVVRARAVLERGMEDTLRDRVGPPGELPSDGAAVAQALFALTAPSPGPSLARFVAKRADREQLRELLVHRSIYQLKEADPHTWAIPRLVGPPKAALVEIQADEYGGGVAPLMHSALFARTMRGAGLDSEYGAYIEQVPAGTLAGVNVMSLFGLHRRLRGATAGHLAAFEMTSSIPNRLYGDGFRRHGFDRDTTWYFDEHVEADAVHEQIAGRALAGGLADQEPELVADILFGAAVCLYLDDVVADQLLASWDAGRSSLRVGS